jgi:hypothetical protein
MRSYWDPEESLPKACNVCERNLSEVDGCCVTCAMQAAVDNDNDQHAYDIAEDFGRPASAVRIMIRKRMEQRLRAEVKAMHSAVESLSRPVCKRCHHTIAAGDEGEWTKTLHGSCENEAVLEYFAKRNAPANNQGKVSA